MAPFDRYTGGTYGVRSAFAHAVENQGLHLIVGEQIGVQHVINGNVDGSGYVLDGKFNLAEDMNQDTVTLFDHVLHFRGRQFLDLHRTAG
jgi:hypothetical protein